MRGGSIRRVHQSQRQPSPSWQDPLPARRIQRRRRPGSVPLVRGEPERITWVPIRLQVLEEAAFSVEEVKMKRRDFIRLIGAVTAAWSIPAHAQRSERTRLIGVLMNLHENDPEARSYVAAFLQGLQDSGWTVGRNMRIDYRWTAGDADRVRRYAAELVGLAPDVILTVGGSHVGPLQQVTRSVPIVFVQVADPVGGGFVESLAHPGGNATGFTVFGYEISAK